MGSIFITNDPDELLIEKIINLYANKKMENYIQISFKEYNILYFKKNNISQSQVYQYNDDIIINVGTIFYKSKIGHDALKEMHTDLTNNIEPYTDIKGHYNLLIIKDNKITIISDKIGIIQLYRYALNSKHYFSNSFLALCEIAESLTLSQQEMMEFITT